MGWARAHRHRARVIARAVGQAVRRNPDPSLTPPPYAERLAALAMGLLVLVGAVGTYVALASGFVPFLPDAPHTPGLPDRGPATVVDQSTPAAPATHPSVPPGTSRRTPTPGPTAPVRTVISRHTQHGHPSPTPSPRPRPSRSGTWRPGQQVFPIDARR